MFLFCVMFTTTKKTHTEVTHSATPEALTGTGRPQQLNTRAQPRQNPGRYKHLGRTTHYVSS